MSLLAIHLYSNILSTWVNSQVLPLFSLSASISLKLLETCKGRRDTIQVPTDRTTRSTRKYFKKISPRSTTKTTGVPLFDIWQHSLCTARCGWSGECREAAEVSVFKAPVCVPNTKRLSKKQTIHLRASGELPNPKNTEQRSIFFGHVQALGNHFTSSAWIYNLKQEDILHILYTSSEEEEAVCVLTLSYTYSDIYARITLINTNKSVISPSWESNTAKQDADTGRRACLERIYWTRSAKTRAHLPNAQKRFHMCR